MLFTRKLAFDQEEYQKRDRHARQEKKNAMHRLKPPPYYLQPPQDPRGVAWSHPMALHSPNAWPVGALPTSPPANTSFAPSGVNVTRTIPENTANWVIQEAKAALRDVQTLDLARHIVRDIVEEHEDPSVARYSEMAAIHDFVSSRVRYTSDPFGIELVYGAKALVERILKTGKFSEDCDGFAVLSLALLLSVGHICQVVLAGYTNVSGWQHIFVQDYMPSLGWITFDPSMKNEVRTVLANVDKIKTFPVNAHLD